MEINITTKKYSELKSIVSELFNSSNSESPIIEFIEVSKKSAISNSYITRYLFAKNQEENTIELWIQEQFENNPSNTILSTDVKYTDNHFAIEGFYNKKIHNFNNLESELFLDNLYENARCICEFAEII